MSNAEVTKEDMYDEIGAVIADFLDGLKSPAECLKMAPVLARQFGQFADAVEIAAWIEEDLDRVSE